MLEGLVAEMVHFGTLAVECYLYRIELGFKIIIIIIIMRLFVWFGLVWLFFYVKNFLPMWSDFFAILC